MLLRRPEQEKVWRLIVGCGQGAYVCDVTATDSIKALSAGVNILWKNEHVSPQYLWQMIAYGNVRVKRVKSSPRKSV